MTDSKVFLSIIIAAHNSEGTLAATLQSLTAACNHDLSGTEIILINDSSTDKTQDIIQDFSNLHAQVKAYQVDYRNIGQVRQFAVEKSSGDYITMLDSDDLLKKSALTEIIKFLKENKPDLLLTKLEEVWNREKINYQWSGLTPEKITRNEAIRRFLIHKDLQAHLIGQFIKRELYLAHKFPPMTCYEDFYIFPGMLNNAHEIYFQHHSLYYYIKHRGSLSSLLNEDKISNLIICTAKMESILPAKFKQLILCHWLDIYIKHRKKLNNAEQLNLVQQHVLMTHTPAFFFNRFVRFSYKKKALSTLWKK
ncbi:glycosyltransferase family 2 protein [Dryocola clanedunensis]